jgi:hypothetical protein
MDARAVDFGPEVRQLVEPALLGSPVELGPPVLHHLVEIGQVCAIPPLGPIDLVRPAGPAEAFFQVLQGCFGDVDLEGLDLYHTIFLSSGARS